jgi:hypothetical protein
VNIDSGGVDLKNLGCSSPVIFLFFVFLACFVNVGWLSGVVFRFFGCWFGFASLLGFKAQFQP